MRPSPLRGAGHHLESGASVALGPQLFHGLKERQGFVYGRDVLLAISYILSRGGFFVILKPLFPFFVNYLF